MKDFLNAAFTTPKLKKLFVSTALGNFTAYIAGSLVTLLSTYHSVERRALRNLFGIMPRKKVVVHLLPDWFEWVLALLVGFLIMEFVRYVINNGKSEAVVSTVSPAGMPSPMAQERQ